MDFTKLEEFSAVKKKGEMSKAKKEEFVRIFTELLKEEKYSNNSEKYFYSCFSITGTDCLYDYLSFLSSNEERNEFINSIISTEKYKKNDKNISYRISLGLLSIIINKHMTDIPAFGRLVCAIPVFAKNKEGKYCSDRDASFAKYFAANLSEKVQLPEIPFNGIKEKATNDFVEFVCICLPSLSECKDLKITVVEKINSWVNTRSALQNESTSNTPIKQESQAINESDKNSTETPIVSISKESLEKKDTISSSEQKAEPHHKLASELLLEIGQRIISGAGLVKDYEHSISQKQKNIEQLKTQISDMKKEICSDKDIIETKSNEISDLQKQVKELIDQNIELNKQVQTMKSVDSVYTNAKDNEITEKLNEIASRLVCDYNDYIAAKDIEMTLDLGENFRYQLKEVFKKLKKAGINVEDLSNG